jgi:hypothetical protein
MRTDVLIGAPQWRIAELGEQPSACAAQSAPPIPELF